MLVLALLPTTPNYRWVKMIMYWGTVVYVSGAVTLAACLMCCSFTIPSFSAWALISSNTAGRTKFSVISALTFIGYWWVAPPALEPVVSSFSHILTPSLAVLVTSVSYTTHRLLNVG